MRTSADQTREPLLSFERSVSRFLHSAVPEKGERPHNGGDRIYRKGDEIEDDQVIYCPENQIEYEIEFDCPRALRVKTAHGIDCRCCHRDETDESSVICRKTDSRHRQDKDQTAPGGEAVIGNQTIAQRTEKKRSRPAYRGEKDICRSQDKTLCGLIQVYSFSVTAPGACKCKTGSEKGTYIPDDHGVQRKHLTIPNAVSVYVYRPEFILPGQKSQVGRVRYNRVRMNADRRC